jgi:translation initiation factor IF-3
MDLVEVAPNANPPVCRLMDYGKFKYEQSVRDREARKNQTKTVIKEVRLRPSTGEHDYQMVLRRVEKFVNQGAKVKVAVRFRGRENERPQMGVDMVNRLVEDLGAIVNVDQPPRKEGRMMNAMLSPNMTEVKRLRKARRKAEQEAERLELEGEEQVEAPEEEQVTDAVQEATEVVEEVLVEDQAETAEPTEETEGADAQSQDA